MNNVSLVGRPTKDPELRYTTGGVAVCTFVLAVDRDFRNREGKREADFIFIRVWNKQAENVAQYVEKGRVISVTGRISTESYQEKDGGRKYRTEVVAENIRFIGSKGGQSKNGEAAVEGGGNAKDSGGFTPVEGEVDIPFGASEAVQQQAK